MVRTYSQIHMQIVFAVQGRKNLISPTNQPELNRYIAGIIESKGQKSIIVNGMPDHIHVLLGLRPAMSVADIVRDIKNNSSKFINHKKWTDVPFSWQEGYGAFSYAKSEVKHLYNYILNQERHHRNKSFRKEYIDTLVQFEIEYEEKYLFDWIDEEDLKFLR